MWITDLFVDSPCRPICACYAFLMMCLLISLAAGFMRPALAEDRDYAIWMDPIQINDDMRNLAMEDV